jgi:Family of unknown function (DUF5677)
VTEPTPHQIAEYRAFLSKMIEESMADMGLLHFSLDSAQHLAVACMYASVVQTVRECQRLLSEPSISAPTILRSLMECHADLLATINDKHHVDRLLATFYFEKLRHVNSMLQHPANPFHADMARYIDPNAEKSQITADLAKIESHGYKRLRMEDRFSAAGLLDVYQSAYWQLCLYGHNTVPVLEERHMVKGQDNPELLELVLYKENSPSELARRLDMLSGLLLNCGFKVHTFLNTNSADTYQQRISRLGELRTKVFSLSAP